MTENQEATIWLIGNITLDTKISNFMIPQNQRSVGGAVSYAGAFLTYFYPKTKIVIISIGNSHLLQLNNDNLRIINKSTISFNMSPTIATHFELNYKENQRTLFLQNWSNEEITYPNKQFNLPSPDIILFLPVYNEIKPKLINIFASENEKAYIACDPQGWFRYRDPRTNFIHHKLWIPKTSFLRKLKVLKLSIADIPILVFDELQSYLMSIIETGVILIITAGVKGSYFFKLIKESVLCYYIPAVSINKKLIIDLTGAGDVFITSFACLMGKKSKIKDSLAYATVMSAITIQNEGLTFNEIPEDGELFQLIQIQKKRIQKLEITEAIKYLLNKSGL